MAGPFTIARIPDSHCGGHATGRRDIGSLDALLTDPFTNIHWALNDFDKSAPLAVAATWVVLALDGRWRSGRSWLDSVGLLFGLFWLSLPILDLLVFRW
jgi:hypothetical protein